VGGKIGGRTRKGVRREGKLKDAAGEKCEGMEIRKACKSFEAGMREGSPSRQRKGAHATNEPAC